MKTRVLCRRHAVACGLLITVMMAAPALLLSSGSQSPLDARQVDGLVRGGVSNQRVAKLVRERGINFHVTTAFLKDLQEDGAAKVLLDQLSHTAPQLPPVQDAPSNPNVLEAQRDRSEGKALLDRAMWNHAETELRKSVQLNPADAAAHFYLGRALSAQGKLDDAIAEYRQAILLSPETRPARFNLGNDLLRKG
ncbi:MAG: tetratricopeptide repeat protein, partial [Terriglobia bacterium]